MSINKNSLLPSVQHLFPAFFLSLVLFIFPAPAEAYWTFDASAGGYSTDNINNAASPQGKKYDTVSTEAVSAGGYFALGEDTGLSLTFDAKGDQSSGYAGLNAISEGLSANLSQKLGLGHEAVRLNLYGSGANETFNDQNRNSMIFKAGLNASRWFNDTIKIGAGYEYDKRGQTNSTPYVCSGYGYYGACTGYYNSDVFNLAGNSGLVNAEFAVTDSDSIVLSYRYRNGDVVSTDVQSAAALAASTAVSPDAAFSGLTAYRYTAVTNSGSIWLSHELLRKLSLNLGYLYYATRSSGGVFYQGNVFNLAFAFSM